MQTGKVLTPRVHLQTAHNARIHLPVHMLIQHKDPAHAVSQTPIHLIVQQLVFKLFANIIQLSQLLPILVIQYLHKQNQPQQILLLQQRIVSQFLPRRARRLQTEDAPLNPLHLLQQRSFDHSEHEPVLPHLHAFVHSDSGHVDLESQHFLDVLYEVAKEKSGVFLCV